MHTLWLFFAWPAGAIWGNVWAMPVCGIVAAVAAYVGRDRLGKALRSWWHRHLGHRGELNEIRTRLDSHADLLDLSTPGGLAAVMSEVKAARVAAETASEAMKLLTVALAPKTPMVKKAGREDGDA